MYYVRVKWNVTTLVWSRRKTCSVQGWFSPGAACILQPEPPDPVSAAKSHACRHQLRTVTAGLVTLQVTEQALVVPGCFLGSLAMMMLVVSNIHCSQWPSSSTTAAQDNTHGARNLGCRAGTNSCLFLPCTLDTSWPCSSFIWGHVCLACVWLKHLLEQDKHGWLHFVSSNYLRYAVA